MDTSATGSEALVGWPRRAFSVNCSTGPMGGILGASGFSVLYGHSNPCPMTTFLDRVLTDLVVVLDRVRTDLVLGQTVDRVLTELGQRLDFLSNSCPRFVSPHDGN